ncbi:MAG: hypothetical protein M1829_001266 [Trizodia sp. TS-e1964]|nr:MAG: hypothetical protein M1829_001266 [Trizodia sp. TS-e1964]
MAEMTSKEFCDGVTGPTIKVLIGPASRTYNVSRDLFAAQSPFFRNFPADTAIRFPHVNPAAFEMLTQWVYQGTICAFPSIKKLFDASAHDSYSGELTNHIELYALASKMEMRKLQNEVIDHVTVLLGPVPTFEAFEVIGRDIDVRTILSFEPNSPACFMTKAILEIYLKTDGSGKLCRMIRDVLVYYWKSGKIRGFEDYEKCFKVSRVLDADLAEDTADLKIPSNPLAKHPSPYYI